MPTAVQSEATRETPDDLRGVEMSLFQPVCGMGMISCYSYTLTVYGNGAVVYVEKESEWSGTPVVPFTKTYQVSEEKVRSLLAEFYKLDYFSLKDNYTRHDWTDCSSSTTSLKVGVSRKTIDHYHCDGSAPQGLSELEAKIDDIVDASQPPTAPAAKLKWKTKIGNLYIDGSPVIFDGLAIFALEDHGLYALDIRTGKQVWQLDTAEGPISSPVLSDGVLYFGTGITGHLYAVNAQTGKENWEIDVTGQHFSPALVVGRQVFFGTTPMRDEGGGAVYALDSETGHTIWQVDAVNGSSGLALDNGTLYFGGSDGKLHAFDAQTGKSLWDFTASANPYEGVGDPVIYNGIAYYSAGDTLYAVDTKTKSEKWHYRAENSWHTRSLIRNDTLYLGVSTPGMPIRQHRPEASAFNYVVALSADIGQEKWKYVTSCCIHGISLASDATLLFGAGDAVHAVVSTNGQDKWQYPITDEDWLDGAPVEADGVFFFGDYGGNAVAVEGP
jgi:outer membrane protein assembly factor BamB